jgi:transcriptional regulator with XRE-family HTH domain
MDAYGTTANLNDLPLQPGLLRVARGEYTFTVAPPARALADPACVHGRLPRADRLAAQAARPAGVILWNGYIFKNPYSRQESCHSIRLQSSYQAGYAAGPPILPQKRPQPCHWDNESRSYVRSTVRLSGCRGWSQLTPSFLSRLERDQVNISVGNLRKLAQFFGVPMTHFFEGEDEVRRRWSCARTSGAPEPGACQRTRLEAHPARGRSERPAIEAQPARPRR